MAEKIGGKIGRAKVGYSAATLDIGQVFAPNNLMEKTTIIELQKTVAEDDLGLTKALADLKAKGYSENFVPCYDHFVYGDEKIELYPHDLFFDDVIRFEDLSAPEGQSILYAISSPKKNVKGIYVESYGLYHDNLSSSMIERMKFCHDLKRGTLNFQ